jgi:ABC-type Fe3+/spermidine/putrescine transport system ATPase subunit
VKVMIRPERIVLEPHANQGDDRLPGIVERSVFLGGSYEVHVRVLGGELLRAMVPNDGSAASADLEPGAAVSLRLPPDAVRVLTRSEPDEATDGAEESEAEDVPAQLP